MQQTGPYQAQQQLTAFENALHELQNFVGNARKLPMSNSCMIDREHLLGLVQDVINCTPTAITEATAVVKNQRSIIDGANKFLKNSQQVADDYKQKVLADVEAHVNQANQNARAIIAQAEQEARLKQEDAQQKWNSIVQEANDRAQSIVDEAQAVADQKVSETEILNRAQMEAEELKQSTQEQIDRLYSDVHAHIDEVLAQLDRSVSEKLTAIRMTRQQFTQNMG